jgi:excisionase family DNA binding protein
MFTLGEEEPGQAAGIVGGRLFLSLILIAIGIYGVRRSIKADFAQEDRLKESRDAAINEYMAGRKENGSMLTTGDVARLLNLHINTVRRWSNEGRLKAFRVGPRCDRRFKKSDISGLLLQK